MNGDDVAGRVAIVNRGRVRCHRYVLYPKGMQAHAGLSDTPSALFLGPRLDVLCRRFALGQRAKCIETVTRSLPGGAQVALVDKVLRAQQAGAVGVIIVDSGECDAGFTSCGYRAGSAKQVRLSPALRLAASHAPLMHDHSSCL
jgi:hypothetical protein